MPYQPDTVAAVVNRLNVQYFLPAIQREYVWQPQQIVQLFDSLMRGYPISSFLFWELKPENKDKWQIYRFLQDFSQKNPHNTLAEGDSVQQLTLVLDGQQRLTSLLIGLKGSYTYKRKYKKWGTPDAWAKARLYLDVLQDPRASDDTNSLRYGFAFFEETPKNTDDKCWVRVGKILEFDSEEAFDNFVNEQENLLPDTATRAQIKTLQKNLGRLYNVIWKDQVISRYTEHDQDYDRVLDIFVRANEGGVKLSKSDLLLSMVTLKWDGINAREEIYNFVDRLNEDLSRKNSFDKDFVMKTCLFVSDLPVLYKVDSFNNQNLQIIRQKWPDIKSAIERTVNLANWFGVDRDNLTSVNTLIPVVYYLYLFPNAKFVGGSTPFEARNAAKIRQWLVKTLLNNVFGSASDTTLTEARRALKEVVADTNADFPAAQIDAKFDRFHASQNAVDSLLGTAYGRKTTYLALTLLYDDNHWGNEKAEQDHIFPRALFTVDKMTAAGLDATTQERYLERVNSLGNLELLMPAENNEKKAKDFSDWLATRDDAFRARHLIPDNSTLLAFDKFEEFLNAREELITERIKKLFAFDVDLTNQ